MAKEPKEGIGKLLPYPIASGQLVPEFKFHPSRLRFGSLSTLSSGRLFFLLFAMDL